MRMGIVGNRGGLSGILRRDVSRQNGFATRVPVAPDDLARLFEGPIQRAGRGAGRGSHHGSAAFPSLPSA
jgi:hypothetical protein